MSRPLHEIELLEYKLLTSQEARELDWEYKAIPMLWAHIVLGIWTMGGPQGQESTMRDIEAYFHDKEIRDPEVRQKITDFQVFVWNLLAEPAEVVAN